MRYRPLGNSARSHSNTNTLLPRYVVFSNVKTQAGLYQVIHDYGESTCALRKLYPSPGA